MFYFDGFDLIVIILSLAGVVCLMFAFFLIRDLKDD